MEKINIGLVGSAGLSAEVLLRILSAHQHAQLVWLVSDSNSGKKIADIHTSLKGLIDMKTVSYDPQQLISDCDVIFFSKPHIASLYKTVGLVTMAKKQEKKVKFIDLSGDFRLKDSAEFEHWYITKEVKDEVRNIWSSQKNTVEYNSILKEAVYGLSELNRDKISKAYFIANPGCYPTGALLGILPLVSSGLADGRDIVINAYSGISGAGRTKQSSNIALEDNIIPYKIAVHQHIPEIEQELSNSLGVRTGVSFAPHVGSFKYGILSTISLKMAVKTDTEKLNETYRDFYKAAPLVRIKAENYPQLKDVVGTNFCDIGFTVDSRNERIVVVTAIDNLYKGASGQAVQNMNIMFGLKEVEGLM
jgi:N-acetyl-gamma-glutamyl-phosphate reductase